MALSNFVKTLAEFRIQAERKTGQLLIDTQKAKGGQPHHKSTSRSTRPVEKTIADMGISKNQSSAIKDIAECMDGPEDRQPFGGSRIDDCMLNKP